MSDQLVTLGHSDTAKHGNRYSAEQREMAYYLWRVVCGRSVRKTAERTGFEERTIRRWIEDEGWQSRGNSDDTEDFGAMQIAAVALATNKVVPAIERMAYLMDHAKDEKVQADAAKWLAGIGGVSPVNRVEQSVVKAPQAAQEAIDLPSLDGLSPEELMAAEDAAGARRIKR